MKFLLFLGSMCLTIGVGLHTESARSSPIPRVRDLGADVHSLFAEKCAGCHNSALGKPEGRFGYVLDLQKVAANPELVIPSKPLQSELYLLIQEGEMPPKDSPFGKLTSAQKELVRSWIGAGAPPPLGIRKSRQQKVDSKEIHR
jgi:mono/diheme cytochrome c family protein